MGVVGLLGLLIGSFAILSASVSSESSPPEYSAADGESPALVLEVEHLKGKTPRLKGKLEDVGVSVGENATLKWTMELTTENGALSVNAPAWELGGQTAFNVSLVMGVWRYIEVFLKNDRPPPDSCQKFGKDNRPCPPPCLEFIFNLTGSTVELTNRWGKSGDKDDRKADYTVDTQSTHQWTKEGWGVWRWVTTDYANWAVLMNCFNKELSSCDVLFILSRERTLPPATLEMLRTVAEQRGFPMAHGNGALVDQTSC